MEQFFSPRLLHPLRNRWWSGPLLLAPLLLCLARPADAGPAAPPAQKPAAPKQSETPKAPPPPSLRPPAGGKAPLGSLVRPVAPIKGPLQPLTPLKKGEKPSEAQARLTRERCAQAGYLVDRANRFGDTSPLTVRYYEQALNLCPGHAVGNFRLAVIRLKQKDRASAQKLFEQVIKWHPRFLDGYYNLGILFRHAANPKEARKYFTKAIEIDPRDPLSLYNLGVLQLLTEERDQSLKNFQLAVREAPGFAEANFFIGALLHDRGNYREGKGALLEALRLKPGLALPRIYLAAILEKEGKAQLAQEELTRALQISPDSIKVGYGFEEFYFREGGANDFLTAVRKRPRENDLPIVSGKALPAPVKAAQKPSPPGAAPLGAAPLGPRREAKELPTENANGEQPPKKGFLYRVKPGDTLAKIAARYGTSMAVLLRLNQDRIEHPEFLNTGEMIRLPRAERKVRTRPAKKQIRPKKNGTAKKKPRPAKTKIAKTPPKTNTAKARTKPARRSPYRLYRVRRGDTLSKIARRFGTSVTLLMRINRDRIEHPAFLSAGAQIRIPGKAPRPRGKPAQKKAPPKKESS